MQRLFAFLVLINQYVRPVSEVRGGLDLGSAWVDQGDPITLLVGMMS